MGYDDGLQQLRFPTCGQWCAPPHAPTDRFNSTTSGAVQCATSALQAQPCMQGYSASACGWLAARLTWLWCALPPAPTPQHSNGRTGKGEGFPCFSCLPSQCVCGIRVHSTDHSLDGRLW
jgi:hypothetical protein